MIMKHSWCAGCLGVLLASVTLAEQRFYLEWQPSGRRLGPFEYREGAELELGKATFKLIPILDEDVVQPSPLQRMNPDYDGILLGDHRHEVIRKLLWVPGVRRDGNGVPSFKKVKGEPFQLYQVFRSPDQTSDLSQVFVFFEQDRVVMVQDTFSGEWIWRWEDAEKEFERKRKNIVAKWGEPTSYRDGFAEWLWPDSIAVLRLDEPNESRAAPELKFGIRKK